MQDERIAPYLAKLDIYELVCTYSRALDRLDGALLESVFFADAWCEYGFHNSDPASFAAFAMEALGAHAANQHFVGNVLIEVDGDEAFGEVYFQAYHKVPTETGFEDIIIAGRYLDRYQQRDGVWKIAYRSEYNDWSRTEPTADSYFNQAPDCLRGSRSDDAVFRKDNRRRPE